MIQRGANSRDGRDSIGKIGCASGKARDPASDHSQKISMAAVVSKYPQTFRITFGFEEEL
jgi:hypothetical protein